MSELDVEDLLRRTYAAVAERTAITGHGDVAVMPSASRLRASWLRPALAWAAVLTLVVSGLVAIAARSDDRSTATVDESTFVHALPGYLPVRGESGDTFLALRRVVTDGRAETTDLLEYGGDGVELTIRTIVGVSVLTDTNTTLLDGAPARIDGAATQLVWQPHPGFEVEVVLTGSDEATLRAVADQLIFVGQEAWADAIDHAGFVRMSHGDGERDPSVVATYELTTDVPVSVGIRGDLHRSFRIEFASAGVLATIPNATVEDCRATASFLPGDADEPTRVVVLANTPRTVEVQAEGGDPRRVEVDVPIPGTQFFIQTFEDATRGAPSRSWTCREVGS